MPFDGPLRPSEIKFAVYGRMIRTPVSGPKRVGGLRFDRVLYAGWSFTPAPGIVAKDFAKLGVGFESFHEPLALAIRFIMMPSIKKNFLAEGRPKKWEPLSEYTVQVRGDSYPILYRTGALMKAAGSFGVWTIGATSASIQKLPSNVWYGNLHQAGYGSLIDVARRRLGAGASEADVKQLAFEIFSGKKASAKPSKFVIPQREFALFQVEDIERIQEIFIEWMVDKAEEVGRGWNR